MQIHAIHVKPLDSVQTEKVGDIPIDAFHRQQQHPFTDGEEEVPLLHEDGAAVQLARCLDGCLGVHLVVAHDMGWATPRRQGELHRTAQQEKRPKRSHIPRKQHLAPLVGMKISSSRHLFAHKDFKE
ncbi:hypothetical protein FOCC_FOCC013993 [Frankliniella occidentalis]|nr:hypothetical protein FOCC_FOCC013993 [Frankliniella occidentalis]